MAGVVVGTRLRVRRQIVEDAGRARFVWADCDKSRQCTLFTTLEAVSPLRLVTIGGRRPARLGQPDVELGGCQEPKWPLFQSEHSGKHREKMKARHRHS